MTAKRFTRCKNEYKVKVYDEVTQEIIPAMRVVELMNELYEDLNHELIVSKVLRDAIKELEKENKQLKNICKNLINEVNKRGITVNISDEYKELLK